jgi:hypothetical protein
VAASVRPTQSQDRRAHCRSGQFSFVFLLCLSFSCVQILIALFTALVALCVPIESLADVISLGSLYAFSVVDCGILLFRYGDGCAGARSKRCVFSLSLPLFLLSLSERLCLLLALFLSGCLGSAVSLLQLQNTSSWQYSDPAFVLGVVFAAVVVVSFVVLCVLPQNTEADKLVFRCPLIPLCRAWACL